MALIEHFNPKDANVMSHIERIQIISNGVESEKKCLFFNLIRGDAYRILKDISALAI